MLADTRFIAIVEGLTLDAGRLALPQNHGTNRFYQHALQDRFGVVDAMSLRKGFRILQRLGVTKRVLCAGGELWTEVAAVRKRVTNSVATTRESVRKCMLQIVRLAHYV